MKGMELPISTVVVVAIVVLVLVVVGAFFLSQSGSQFNEISERNRFNQLCASVQCSYSDSSKIGESSDFYKSCKALYGQIRAYDCLKACGCSDAMLTEGTNPEETAMNIEQLKKNIESI